MQRDLTSKQPSDNIFTITEFKDIFILYKKYIIFIKYKKGKNITPLLFYYLELTKLEEIYI